MSLLVTGYALINQSDSDSDSWQLNSIMKKYINGIELTNIRISKDCTYADYVGVTLHNIMLSFAVF